MGSNPTLSARCAKPPKGGFLRLGAPVGWRVLRYNPGSRNEAKSMSEIQVPVSFGELLDKIAILQIKSERMSDEA